MKKKPKHPRALARTTAAVGRIMWLLEYAYGFEVFAKEKEAIARCKRVEYLDGYPPKRRSVLVLPADKEGVEKLRYMVARTIAHLDGVPGFHKPHQDGPYSRKAGAILFALGIPPHAATGRGKGKNLCSQ